MKTFSEFIKEGPEEPKPKGEKDFKDAHTDNTDKIDYPVDASAAFKPKTFRVKRGADRADQDPKQS